MPRALLYIIYGLMVAVGLVAMYCLLNAGSPHSLLRLLWPDPTVDIYVAAGSSVMVFILGFFVFYSRDREGFRELLELNADHIRALRKKGKKNEEIANSILAAMGSSSGYRHNMARKKLIAHLSDFR